MIVYKDFLVKPSEYVYNSNTFGRICAVDLVSAEYTQPRLHYRPNNRDTNGIVAKSALLVTINQIDP